MLTIGELASYAGVTLRAVRHYHAKGLLPEPERDHSGYRRYDAGAVVELIKIRTLAEAGVPLARVRELLQADEEEFAAAVTDIDQRLRAEIRERQRHRERIARLAAGDNVALPRRWSSSSTACGRSASTNGSSRSNATAGSRWPRTHPSGPRSGWPASGSRSPTRGSSASTAP
nr:MerR family transcriptional regulator [Streptomyces botrytidirepellens]